LFSKGRKIIFSIEFVYKEVTSESTTVKGKKKKKNASEAQRLQRAAEASLWVRLYEKYRCRAKHCKHRPYCFVDKQGNHHPLLLSQLEDTVSHIKSNMKEGEKEENIDVNAIELPPHILQSILDNSSKRKAEGSSDYRPCKVHASAHTRCCDAAADKDPGDVEGDRQARLTEYCNWTLTQVSSDRWRSALQVANQVTIDQFLELNMIRKHPKIVADLIVKNRVKPGIALQFVSNIEKFQREEETSKA
jgi:hypothetical protein